MKQLPGYHLGRRLSNCWTSRYSGFPNAMFDYWSWLVVWNIWIIFPYIYIYIGNNHHPNWRTPSFFKMVIAAPTRKGILRVIFDDWCSSARFGRFHPPGWRWPRLCRLPSCACQGYSVDVIWRWVKKKNVKAISKYIQCCRIWPYFMICYVYMDYTRSIWYGIPQNAYFQSKP